MYIYDATPEEKELVKTYYDTKDYSIVRHIIEHPWSYNVAVVMWAINVECNILALEETK